MNGTDIVDLAREHATLFARLRGPLPPGRIEGLTGWSDWVALRGELEGRGWRIAGEAPVAAPASGRAHLFRWTLAPRASA